MSEEIKSFMDNLASGENAQAGESFKDALRAKVASGLDAKRKDMAAQMFNQAQQVPEAESFSDPKPEVAEPGTFNQDGSVSSTKDGSVDIDLTTDENK